MTDSKDRKLCNKNICLIQNENSATVKKTLFSASDVWSRGKPKKTLFRSLSTNNASIKTARSTKIAALRKQALPQANEAPVALKINEAGNERNTGFQNYSYKTNTLFRHRTEVYEGQVKVPIERKLSARINWKPQKPVVIREWESTVVKHSPRIVEINDRSSQSFSKIIDPKKSLVCEISQVVDFKEETIDNNSQDGKDSPITMSLISSNEKLYPSPMNSQILNKSNSKEVTKISDSTCKNNGDQISICGNIKEDVNENQIKKLSGVDDFNKMDRSNQKSTILLEQLETAIINHNNLKKDYDCLQLQLEDFKLKNQGLQVECSENNYYIQRNQHLEKRVADLTNALLQKDACYAKMEKEYFSIEKSTDFMKEKVLKLNAEIDKLRTELFEQEEYILENENQKNINLLKDLEIKTLHNQLINLRGKIRVVARFKPETNDVFEFTKNNTVRINPSILTFEGKAKQITFDKVFNARSSQSDVFDEVEPYIKSVIDGYNVCILTFGQTGSGKTYTMNGNKSNPGIIPRVLPHILKLTKQRVSWNFKFNLSVVQIYNEAIMDLLSDKVSFLSLVDTGITVIMREVTEKTVSTDLEMQEYIQLGRRRRKTAKTIFNSESSRSHFIVILRILGESREGVHTEGILNFCDLAGFEKTAELPTKSQEVNESKYIGKSLTGLARVLNALQHHEKCIPYRDSKLTHLLKPSLSGEAKCVLILTLSTCSDNINASIRTLEMGQQALSITLGQAQKQSSVHHPAHAKKRADDEAVRKPHGSVFTKISYPRTTSPQFV